MARITGTKGLLWANAGVYVEGSLFIDYSTSQTDTQYKITTSAGVILDMNTGAPGGAAFSMSGARTEAEKGVSFSQASPITIFSSKTITINKSKSTQTIKINENVRVTQSPNPSAAPSSAVLSVSVPAKPSYAITYNANGGTGAPTGQTKWYDEDINLQAGKPTRTGYAFKCWNTKQNGTGTNYNPSQKYSTNAGLTLYAIWEPLNKVTIYDQNGNAHTGRLYIYDDNGNRHQCIISVYDENGNRKYPKG